MPGDPFPCDPELEVDVKFGNGEADLEGEIAGLWSWDVMLTRSIIAWRAHKPEAKAESTCKPSLQVPPPAPLGTLLAQLDEKDAAIADLNQRLIERTEALLLMHQLYTQEITRLRLALKQTSACQ